MAAPDGMPTHGTGGVTTTITVHVPKDLADRVQRLAEENERSIQGEIRRAIRNHLADQEVRDELEAIPVASAQKIAALRPKHKKESD